MKAIFRTEEGQETSLQNTSLHNIIVLHAEKYSKGRIWAQNTNDECLFNEIGKRISEEGGVYLLINGERITI